MGWWGEDKDGIILFFNSSVFESIQYSKQELVLDFSICMLIFNMLNDHFKFAIKILGYIYYNKNQINYSRRITLSN